MLMAQSGVWAAGHLPGSEALVIFNLAIHILVLRLVKGTLGQLSHVQHIPKG